MLPTWKFAQAYRQFGRSNLEKIGSFYDYVYVKKKTTSYIISVYIYEGRCGRVHCDLNMISSGRWGLKKSGFQVRWLALCYIFCTVFI